MCRESEVLFLLKLNSTPSGGRTRNLWLRRRPYNMNKSLFLLKHIFIDRQLNDNFKGVAIFHGNVAPFLII